MLLQHSLSTKLYIVPVGKGNMFTGFGFSITKRGKEGWIWNWETINWKLVQGPSFPSCPLSQSSSFPILPHLQLYLVKPLSVASCQLPVASCLIYHLRAFLSISQLRMGFSLSGGKFIHILQSVLHSSLLHSLPLNLCIYLYNSVALLASDVYFPIYL